MLDPPFSGSSVARHSLRDWQEQKFELQHQDTDFKDQNVTSATPILTKSTSNDSINMSFQSSALLSLCYNSIQTFSGTIFFTLLQSLPPSAFLQLTSWLGFKPQVSKKRVKGSRPNSMSIKTSEVRSQDVLITILMSRECQA